MIIALLIGIATGLVAVLITSYKEANRINRKDRDEE